MGPWGRNGSTWGCVGGAVPWLWGGRGGVGGIGGYWGHAVFPPHPPPPHRLQYEDEGGVGAGPPPVLRKRLRIGTVRLYCQELPHCAPPVRHGGTLTPYRPHRGTLTP